MLITCVHQHALEVSPLFILVLVVLMKVAQMDWVHSFELHIEAAEPLFASDTHQATQASLLRLALVTCETQVLPETT
jgi:hypothetical protein